MNIAIVMPALFLIQNIMLTYKKLSQAQKRVIDFLKESKNSYSLKSTTWNYQRMINPDLVDSDGYSEYEYFNKATMKALVRENVLIRSHFSDDFMKDRYVLNPDFSFEK